MRHGLPTPGSVYLTITRSATVTRCERGLGYEQNGGAHLDRTMVAASECRMRRATLSACTASAPGREVPTAQVPGREPVPNCLMCDLQAGCCPVAQGPTARDSHTKQAV